MVSPLFIDMLNYSCNIVIIIFIGLANRDPDNNNNNDVIESNIIH